MRTIIAGARTDGHAKVVLEILLAQGEHEVVGFIDDDPSKKGTNIRNYPVLGNMADLPTLKTKLKIKGAIVAIGNNVHRRHLSAKLEDLGFELVNAIHPTVHLDSDVQIGKGNYLGQGVIIVTGTKIGNCINIHTATTIDHDNIIEDGANIGPGCHTSGRVIIGKDAFLGTGTVVIPDKTIGEGAVIGAGTVVIRDIESHIKVVGVPAKIIKKFK